MVDYTSQFAFHYFVDVNLVVLCILYIYYLANLSISILPFYLFICLLLSIFIYPSTDPVIFLSIYPSSHLYPFFHSIYLSIQELVPQFYQSGDFLTNNLGIDFGVRQVDFTGVQCPIYKGTIETYLICLNYYFQQ